MNLVSELELYYIIIAHVVFNEGLVGNECDEFRKRFKELVGDAKVTPKRKPRLYAMYQRLYENTINEIDTLQDLHEQKIVFLDRCVEFCNAYTHKLGETLNLAVTSSHESIACNGTPLDGDHLTNSITKVTGCETIEGDDCTVTNILNAMKSALNVTAKDGDNQGDACWTKMPSFIHLKNAGGGRDCTVWDSECRGPCGPNVSRYLDSLPANVPIPANNSAFAAWAWEQNGQNDANKYNHMQFDYQVYVSMMGVNMIDSIIGGVKHLSEIGRHFNGHLVGVLTISVTNEGSTIKQYCTETFLTRSRILDLIAQENVEDLARRVRIFCNEVVALAPIMHDADLPPASEPKRCFYQTLTVDGDGFTNMLASPATDRHSPNAHAQAFGSPLRVPSVRLPLGRPSSWAHSVRFGSPQAPNAAAGARPLQTAAYVAFRYSYWVSVALLLCALFVRMYIRGI